MSEAIVIPGDFSPARQIEERYEKYMLERVKRNGPSANTRASSIFFDWSHDWTRLMRSAKGLSVPEIILLAASIRGFAKARGTIRNIASR